MTEQYIKWAVTLLILLVFFVDFALKILNMNASLRSRGSVPPFIKSSMTLEEVGKSVDYTQSKSRFSLVMLIFNTILKLFIIHSGFLNLLGIFIQRISTHQLLYPILFWGSLLILLDLIQIPFQLFGQFVLEEQYGFNKMSVKIFAMDKVKNFMVSLVLGTPLALALLLIYSNTGPYWWLWCFGIYTVYQLIVVVLYPVVIAPLFNKFAPLEDGELKEQLQKLTERTGFSINGLYVKDGSRRSAHSNAYFTGIGKAKRIVLFDTLMNELTNHQIEAVLAHEIGHYKKKHILLQMIGGIIASGLFFYSLTWLLQWTPFFQAFGFASGDLTSVLAILIVFSGIFSYFLTPLGNALSRRNEYQADAFAKEAVGNGNSLAEALVVMSSKNLSNLSPHPLFSRWFYSHPVLSERIAALTARESIPEEETP